tara:strand:+ start:1799 stop:2329 length:531 start_codon:yes stop_codon:yes gene_type:complete
MEKKDKSKKFIPINICVLTISDTRDESNDKSGILLCNKIKLSKHIVYDKKIVKDNPKLISKYIKDWSSNKNIDVIISTGGTGLTGRDSTPETIKNLADKIIEGFGEIFRLISFKKIGTSTIQSRALGAIINGTYVFALPGSTSACNDAWNEILVHQLDIRHQPCNFIELIPRLKEK